MLLSRGQAKKTGAVADRLSKRELGQEVSEKCGGVAALRCFSLAMLLAGSVPVLLSNETSAQVQEITPPIHSSGLHNGGRVGRTPVIEQSGLRSATQAPFNGASLPPIDSINAGTDIRPFLDPHVPPDLTLAALRRAWVTDPVIHDFIGLSENSWDFNTPDAMTGTGSPTANDADRLRMETRGTPLWAPQAKAPKKH